MKTRGLEKTSTQMLTLFLSSFLLCLAAMSPSDIHFQPPLLLILPFVRLPSQSLTWLSPYAFSPSPIPLISLSLPPHCLSLSLSSEMPSPPVYPYSQLVQYRSRWATVRQIGIEGGSTDTGGNAWRAAVHGALCCSIPVCTFRGALRGRNDKRNRAHHLWVKRLIEMDIS